MWWHQLLSEFSGTTTWKSIEDLKTKYVQDFPTDKLVTIPVVKLQDYNSVPCHLTEEDIMANIEMEEKETLEKRSQILHGKKQDILNIIANRQLPKTYVSKKLNDLLFEEVIATYECTCQQGT